MFKSLVIFVYAKIVMLWFRILLFILDKIKHEENKASQNQDTDSCLESNSNIYQYLQYYKGLDAPGYAVLINGPWGIGKTHQIKKIISLDDRYYISIYGIDSIQGIHDAVLASTTESMMSKNTLSNIRAFSKAIPNKYGVNTIIGNIGNIYLRSKLKPDKILIFDDLERSSLWNNKIDDLLGAINYYVEHLGFKVVVICNEDKLTKRDSSKKDNFQKNSTFLKVKEKIFGHTLLAKPETDTALKFFISSLNNSDVKTFLNENIAIIQNVWKESKAQSLRILKQIIYDLERLLLKLDKKYLNNDEAKNAILYTFCAINIEVRCGDLIVNQISQLNLSTATDEPSVKNLMSKYTHFNDYIFSKELLIEMLIDGIYNNEKISNWLDHSSFFTAPNDIPAWMAIYQLDNITNEELEKAIKHVDEQIKQRSISNVGEFLHIVAIKLMLAKQGLIATTTNVLKQEFKAYIDQIKENDLFIENFSKPYSSIEKINSYGGIAFWVWPSWEIEFNEIYNYFEACLKLAFTNNKKLKANILEHVSEGILSEFFEAAYDNYQDLGYLLDNPIFSEIPVSDFVNAWLKGPPATRISNGRAIWKRFMNNSHCLKDEYSWYQSLEIELTRHIDLAIGLEKYQIARLKLGLNDVFQKTRPKP